MTWHGIIASSDAPRYSGDVQRYRSHGAIPLECLQRASLLLSLYLTTNGPVGERCIPQNPDEPCIYVPRRSTCWAVEQRGPTWPKEILEIILLVQFDVTLYIPDLSKQRVEECRSIGPKARKFWIWSCQTIDNRQSTCTRFQPS